MPRQKVARNIVSLPALLNAELHSHKAQELQIRNYAKPGLDTSRFVNRGAEVIPSILELRYNEISVEQHSGRRVHSDRR